MTALNYCVTLVRFGKWEQAEVQRSKAVALFESLEDSVRMQEGSTFLAQHDEVRAKIVEATARNKR